MVRATFAALVIGLGVVAGTVRGEPGVFSEAGYEADRAAAIERERLHVVYFTAEWCPPCKQMKKTTWVDESVVAWLDERAVVSAVDVDEQGALAESYRVRAMPTVVVLRGGEELARTVGYQGADELVDWLGRAERGEVVAETPQTPEEMYNEAFESARETGQRIRQFQERLGEASNTVFAGPESYERATELYVELIPELIESELVDLWEDHHGTGAWMLVQEFPRARTEFTAIRDAIEEQLKGGAVSWDLLSGWAVLNEVLDEQDRTISWLERRVAGGDGIPSSRVIHELAVEAAVEARRFDLLKGVVNPVQESQEADYEFDFHQSHLLMNEQAYGEDELMMMREAVVESRRYELSHQHALALAIGDGEAALTIQRLLLARDDTPEAREVLAEAARELGVEMIELPE